MRLSIMRLSSCFFSPCFFLFFLRSSSVIRKVVGSKKRPNKTQIMFCFSLSFESSCGCEGGDGEDDDGLKSDFCFSLYRREKKRNEEEEEELSLNHFLSCLSLETPDDKEREGDCSSLSLLFQTRKRTMSAPEARGEDVEMLAKWREVREQISGARERERGEEEERRRESGGGGGRKKSSLFRSARSFSPPRSTPDRLTGLDSYLKIIKREQRGARGKQKPPKTRTPPLFFLFRRATGKNPNALSFFPFRK